MRRIIAVVLLVPVLVAVLMLSVLTWMPQRVLGWVSASMEGVDLNARTLDLGWWPFRLRAGDLDVQTAGEPPVQQHWRVGRLDVQVSTWDGLRGQPFWHVAASDVVQQGSGSAAAQTAAEQAPVAGAQTAQAQPTTLQIPALPTLLSFRQILVERLALADDTQVDLRLEHQGATLDIDVKVVQPQQTLVVVGTGQAPQGLLMDSNAVDLDLKVTWQGPDLMAVGQLVQTLEIQPQQALLLNFAPSEFSFSRAGEMVRRFDLHAGDINWRFVDDSLGIQGLSGTYALAGEADSHPLSLEVVVEQLSASPQARVNMTFGQSELSVLGQLARPTNTFAGELSFNTADLPSWLVSLPYHNDQIYPLMVSTEFVAGAASISLNKLSVNSPRNQGKGEITVQLPGDDQLNWQVSGRFNAPRWLIPLVNAPLDPQASDEQSSGAEAGQQDELADASAQPPPDNAEAPLFSAEPIDWSWLDLAQMDVQISAEQLDLQDAQWRDVQFNLAVSDGSARIEPLKAAIGDAGLDARVQLVKQPDGTVAADVRYTLDGLSLDMFGLFPEGEIEGGRLSSDLQLTAQGVSSLDLVNTLNGTANFRLYEMTIRNNMVDLVGSDLILETLNRLNPFKEREPATQLQCAFFAFDVNDGVIRSRDDLVVETRKMRIEANARIALAEEDLDLTFSPKPKGGFGVGLTNVVKFVKLGGKLRSPGMEVDAMGLVNSGAAVGAALSTGGLSILAEGLANRVLGDSGCAQEVVTVELPAEETTRE
ncbi:MAG: AsmA-like C-terminal region-containing protein [bacterium]